ncbi:hypothetical protein Cyrtocomes_00865 [Candidatus Cyrtobacter comes]|uniref:Uncharacterized protein n=1 Tax=Candidatus Cyrtobacter comes TaxID=675776 RepID=A0ABU5L8N1_9RICK|nr:hypothetical protein [Candidatus Cyrtobacter comes]
MNNTLYEFSPATIEEAETIKSMPWPIVLLRKFSLLPALMGHKNY